MTLRSIELNNAVNNSKSVVADREKKDQTMKQAAQHGRRVSNLGKTTQNKVVANHEAVAAAMNHRRNPTMAKELIEKAAEAVEASISAEEAKPTLDVAAAAKAEAEAAALAAAQAEEMRRQAEEEEQKRLAELSKAQREQEEAAAAAAAAAAEAAAAAATVEESQVR